MHEPDVIKFCKGVFLLVGRGTSQGGVKPEMDRKSSARAPCYTVVASKPEPIKQLWGASSEENVSYHPDSASVFSPRRGWRLDLLQMVLLQISDLTATETRLSVHLGSPISSTDDNSHSCLVRA